MGLYVSSSPLIELLDKRGISRAELGRLCARRFNVKDGVRLVSRVLNSDYITIETADRLVIALGEHPALIWGEEWWEPRRMTGKDKEASCQLSSNQN